MATLYDKKLNGILADEMGLGKTIQTIGKTIIIVFAWAHQINSQDKGSVKGYRGKFTERF